MPQAGLEYTVSVDGVKELRERLLQKGYIIGHRVTDKAVAEVGAAGRRAVDAVYRRRFHIGETQTKWKKNTGAMVRRKFSAVDSRRGIISTTRASIISGPFKMSNFSFETAHAITKWNKGVGVTFDAFSKAYFTSQLANLWERPTKAYTKRSPWFRRGDSATIGTWRKGKARPSRALWSQAQNAVRSAVPRALVATERKLAKEIEE